MRADRLLSLLMLLQTRGRVTAQSLADELEVSVRTIYRDMDALSAAGVPVYADAGPGGGCALLEDYRTNLTGLREDEIRALFMLSTPAALTDLGYGSKLKDAMLKLTAALPATHYQDEAWVRQRILLDWSWWTQTSPPPPHLHVLQRAIWADHQVRIRYRRTFGSSQIMFERTVDPHGLVAKAGAWYLVCAADGSTRVFAVVDLLDVQTVDMPCARPAEFDLRSFWSAWCERTRDRRGAYAVTAYATPACASLLEQRFGVLAEIPATAPPNSGAKDRRYVEIHFDSLEDARRELLGFGGAIEVLTPDPLRLSLADFARQIVQVYER